LLQPEDAGVSQLWVPKPERMPGKTGCLKREGAVCSSLRPEAIAMGVSRTQSPNPFRVIR